MKARCPASSAVFKHISTPLQNSFFFLLSAGCPVRCSKNHPCLPYLPFRLIPLPLQLSLSSHLRALFFLFSWAFFLSGDPRSITGETPYFSFRHSVLYKEKYVLCNRLWQAVNTFLCKERMDCGCRFYSFDTSQRERPQDA